MSNESAKELSPISQLPSKVLARIFALAKVHCIHRPGRCGCGHSPINDRFHKFDTFVGVCARWYTVAVNTPSLWNHIDIGPNTPKRWTRLLLERSKDASLHVHVYVGAEEPSTSAHFSQQQQSKPEYRVPGAVFVLAPHIQRVRRLALEIYASPGHPAAGIVQLWLNFGSPNPYNSLDIFWPNADQRDVFYWSKLPGIRKDRLDNYKNMILSIGYLHWTGVAPGRWGQGLFRNLVYLQLEGTTIPLPLPACVFLDILLACRDQLETLMLNNISITPVLGWLGCAPIPMSRLRFLNLIGLEGEHSMRLVLPLIGLPPIAGERIVLLRVHEHMQDVHAQFFARSYMTFLHCHTKFCFAPNRSFMMSLPSVNLLVLSNFNLLKEPVADGVRPISAMPTHPIPNVTLWSCPVGFWPMVNLITRHQVQNLWVRYRPRDCNASAFQIFQSFGIRWVEIFPGLRCDVSMIEYMGEFPAFEVLTTTSRA
ncbi:hypothetical protein FRC12_025079 [Ceratobasidium sp. 428]|nr:hypothetical protein FRC12_025079 [Ceratobasidium sp. 428]